MEGDMIVPEPITVRPNQQKLVVHRLTVVMQAHHQVHGGDAESVNPTPFERELTTEEEMYDRATKIGTSPRPLDLGWVDGKAVALIAIENLESPKARDRVIELLLGTTPALLVPAGETLFFTPVDASAWSVRGQVDSVKFRIYVIPG